MCKIIILITIVILGLTYATEDNAMTQVLNPQFEGTDFSIPKSINFQGYLYRDGNPMDTTMNMWFGIYDAPSSGTQLFQQTINNVIVTKGWFTVSLDNIPNSVFPVAGPTRYLDVKAPSTGPSLSPRISLVSVGYSYHSITADSAEYAKAAPLSRPITPPIYSAEIRDTTIITTKIKDGAITNSKLGPNAVTADKIQNGTILSEDLSFTPATRPLTPPISCSEIAKPCTLQTSTAFSDAVLYVKNTGTGDALRVFRAGNDGVQVDSAGYGFSLYRAATDGLWIARAGNNGIYIDSAGYEGIYINRAGRYGVRVARAGYNGVWIDSASYEGIYINRVGNYGVHVARSGYDGFCIDSTGQGDGVHVGRAGYCGVLVDHANASGLRVDSAGVGVYIYETGAEGVRICNAGVDGIYIDHAAYDGIYISRVSDNGFYIYRAGEDGFEVDSAGRYGFRVWEAAENGMMIDNAGIYGVFARSNGSAPFAGVYGEGPTSTVGAYGVYGYARNKGVYGKSNFWEGVYGDADADDAVEGYYYGNTAMYAGVHGRRANYGYGVYYEGGIGGSDKMSTLVKTSKGPVALYAQESPENWFEDFGEGKLINGHCRVELDKLFLETVSINDQFPLKVFIQLEDNCNGVYVKKNKTGFDVYELQNGTSNAAFTYRVVAKRKGFEDLRLKTEVIGYTDQQLYPDLKDPQIPVQIRAKRLEEIENRKKEEEKRKNNQLEKNRKEERQFRLEKK